MQLKRPVWAEINLANIVHNYQEVKRLIEPSVKVMAVVKANAYGHGAVHVSKALEKENVDYFGVALMEEASELRTAGINKPILVLGWTPQDEYSQALQAGVSLTLFTLKEAEELNKMARERNQKAIVHIKIDTGMGRLGFEADENSLKQVKSILSLENLFVEGIFTHLARADEKHKEFTQKQLAKFQDFYTKVEQITGYHFPLKHAANSAAIIDFPPAHFNLVRPGIMLYGLKPSDEVNLTKIDLRQALSLKARVSYVKEVMAKTPISYGGNYLTKEKSLIATLPVGYGDGYSRLLSDQAEVICQGKRVPVVGNICMDQIMVNVSDLNKVSQGEVVTLIGKDQNEFISVDELAQKMKTINYEITCLFSLRVPRVYQEK